MATAKMGVGWFLGPAFAMLLACSSAQTGARSDGGTHAGAGGGAGGATSDAGFACGDARCSVVEEYCRDLTNGPGGAPGANDGGPSGPVHIVSCVPFSNCTAAHDCSCVPQHGGYFCGACSQDDGGGTFAICGSI